MSTLTRFDRLGRFCLLVFATAAWNLAAAEPPAQDRSDGPSEKIRALREQYQAAEADLGAKEALVTEAIAAGDRTASGLRGLVRHDYNQRATKYWPRIRKHAAKQPDQSSAEVLDSVSAKLRAQREALLRLATMYDRLDAAMLMMAGAITGGDVTLKGVDLHHLEILEAKLLQMGVELDGEGDRLRVRGPETFSPINVVTTYYPGFPTDLQPSITAMACVAEGDSFIRETVFEDRFGHVKNLRAFGASLSPEKDRLVIVHGPVRLKGTRVRADDIRAGEACVLAGLIASGRTSISNLYQLDRGHAQLEERLKGLGAEIERL